MMSTESTIESRTTVQVGDLEVTIVRKDIKNLHLSVYPPEGNVKVSAPVRIDDEAVRLAVIEKLGWIRRQQRELSAQERQTPREYISGETHYFLGRPYRLRVTESDQPVGAAIRNKEWIEIYVRPGTSIQTRAKVLTEWYREELHRRLAPLVAEWQENIGVNEFQWSIRRMKTKWGSCTPKRQILFNLELAKKSPECIEYLVVHELVHLIEPRHGDTFKCLMDRYMPNWRHLRSVLNAAPLSHQTWTY